MTQVHIYMPRRFALPILLGLYNCAIAFSKVETVGDITFAVADGWTYERGTGFAELLFVSGQAY